MSVGWKSHRRPRRLTLFKKMEPLTTLIGREFVESWLGVVKSHAVLWKHGVGYGDPSLWNIVYDPEHTCGVLTDYDLSVSRHLPRVPGFDRTGIIPFMAVGLLNDLYWNGDLERLYHHELEAFVWILIFVFVRYQDKKPQKGAFVDAWITSNHITCRKEKLSLSDGVKLIKVAKEVQKDFRTEWPLAMRLLRWAIDTHLHRVRVVLPGDEPTSEAKTDAAGVWNDFVAQLKLSAKAEGLQYVANAVQDLGLENLFVDGDTSSSASPSKSS
ncbi:hypothetical protein FPV67DRAFT_1451421 [Lyophyllum atratum]|nr:hypothetical protein FPV67DRAFT_1451421 [Lyophyllum atratum]